MELGAKLGEGGVVDPPVLHKPHEIEAVAAGLFQSSAAANAAIQAIQNARRDIPRMDRRLSPPSPFILGFPRRPIDAIQDFIEQSNRVIPGNQRFEAAHNSLPIYGRLGPITPCFHNTPTLFKKETNTNTKSALATISCTASIASRLRGTSPSLQSAWKPRNHALRKLRDVPPDLPPATGWQDYNQRLQGHATIAGKLNQQAACLTGVGGHSEWCLFADKTPSPARRAGRGRGTFGVVSVR